MVGTPIFFWLKGVIVVNTRLVWSDRQASRDRKAWMILRRGGKLHRFGGQDIPGLVVIVHQTSVAEGKWSHTTYTLALSAGTSYLSGHLGWDDGTFLEGLRKVVGGPDITDWGLLATALGVSVTEAKSFLQVFRPKEAEHLDAVEASLMELEAVENHEGNVVSITFGAPTNKCAERGFWTWPITAELDGQVIGRLVRQPSQRCAGSGRSGEWAVESGPLTIIETSTSSGYHGGWETIRMACPVGTTLHHREPMVQCYEE